MEDLLNAICFEVDGIDKGKVRTKVREILNDDYDLVPTEFL